MGIGFGFKVVPGVRVRVSSRGVRTSVGPRGARVHVGAGRTTISSGVGPVTVWASGGRKSSGSTRRRYGPTPAQLERQSAALARAQAAEERLATIRELATLQQELVSAHMQPFVDATPPVVPEPVWVYPEQYLQEAEGRHLAGVGRFDRSGRAAARQAATLEAAQAATTFNAHLDVEYQARHGEAQRWWTAFLGNEPTTVLAAVNEAFQDSASPAAALSVESGTLAAVMIQPAAEEFVDQKATLTPGGKPTIARMTKTEQRQQWTSCTLSRAVAVIAEALAVAPGLTKVHLAVVTRAAAGTGPYRLIVVADASREQSRSARWPSVLTTDVLARGGNFVFNIDRYGALSDIPTTNDSQLQALIDGLNGIIDDEPDLELDHLDLASPPDVPALSPPSSLVARLPVAPASPLPQRAAGDAWTSARAAAPPTGADPAGRRFALWGYRSSYGNVEVKGTEHRQDAILALLPRPTSDGVSLDSTAELLPEPTNPFDANAVACWVDGRLIGYLPREEAPNYAPALSQLVRSGRTPTVSVHLWAREFDDYDYDERGNTQRRKGYYTSARIGIAEPHLLAPINLPPPKPRVELPEGGSVKVSGTQEHLAHLLSILGERHTAWAYATIEPTTVSGARTTKTVAQVLVNGHSIGTLSAQMSSAFLPIIEPLTAHGCNVAARLLLTGSPVSVAASIHAARAHAIARDWFDQVERDTGIRLGSIDT